MAMFFFLLSALVFILLVIGLIYPKAAIYWGRREGRNRKKVLLYYGLGLVVFFTLFIVSLPELTSEQKAAIEQERIAKAESKAEKEQIAAAEKAEKERLEAERKAQEEQLAADKKIEQERLAAEEKEEQERAAAEKKVEEERKAAEEALLKEQQEQQRIEQELMQQEAERTATKEKSSYIEYERLARNPDHYIGEYVVFSGEVIQVVEDVDRVILIVNTLYDEYVGYYEDAVYVEYKRQPGEGRILENDLINFYGEHVGLISYESIWGNQVTIPQVNASIIEFSEYAY